MLSSSFNNLISFIKRPILLSSDIKDQRIKLLFLLLFQLIIAKVVITTLTKVMMTTFNIESKNTAFRAILDKFGPSHIILYGLLLTPLIEEFVFRGYLTLKLKMHLIWIPFATYYFLTIFYFKKTIIEQYDKQILVILIGIAISIIFHISVKPYQDKVSSFYERNFRIFFWLSCFIFAFAHVGNFSINSNELYMLPILLLPNLVGGIYFAYVRVRLGLVYAIALHTLSNAVPASIMLLIYYGPR